MKFLLSISLFMFATIAFAQSSFTVKGKIRAKSTFEDLSGITVGVKELPGKGVFSDETGEYSIDLPAGNFTLVFRFLGYSTKEMKVEVKKNTTFNVELQADEVALKEVEISALKKDHNIKSVQMGVDRLEIETANKIPVLFGERDILKTLQLLPGVQAAGEGRTGFYVRGGSDDQNLILLDNATVYNPSHLFGFFSTFNSDVVDDMTLYKGSIPAQYGGRLSSVLDVNTRDSDMKNYNVSGGIGLISSKLTLEGPLQKNRSSFLVSGRRTYADAVGKAMGVKELKGQTLYFYDLNAKFTYLISEKDKITLTGYHGLDKLGIADLVGFDWGNTFGSLKWNHTFDSKKASTTTLTVNDYKFNVEIDLVSAFHINSHITDYTLNQEFNIFPNDKHGIKFGYNTIYRNLTPGDVSVEDPSKWENMNSFARRYAWENAIFGNDNMKINDKLEFALGLRLSTASTLGGGNFYTYDYKQNVLDTLSYKKGSFVKTYFNVEPRLSVAYQLNDVSSVKGGYTRTAQNMHMLKISNMEATPSDRWISNNNYIKPEYANQFSVGYFRNFKDNAYEFSAEVYYKNLENQIDYKDGTANIVSKENIEPYLLFGKGRAYGLELFLKKRRGRFNGWIGYTLSRSEKKIDGINHDKWYVANQDRTHDFSLVGIYDLTNKWTVSATWVYTSGAPMTLPSGKYYIGEGVNKTQMLYYEGRNLYRAADYHRLDLGATCVLKKTKKHSSELVFSLYNAYARKNPYIYQFKQNEDNPMKSESSMIYLFSAIPSISWNFKF